MHTLLAVRKLFPEHFSNYVFIRVGEVDFGHFPAMRESWKRYARGSTGLPNS